MILVLMGVSNVGKLGKLLAASTGCKFEDADAGAQKQ
jgi:hypothetical protein